MGNVEGLLSQATGDEPESKWDNFNKAAIGFLDDLIKRGLITRYEVCDFEKGKMNCFFIFQADVLLRDSLLQRIVSREFTALWLSYGITWDDMIYDGLMGLRFVTEDTFERMKENTELWGNTVC